MLNELQWDTLELRQKILSMRTFYSIVNNELGIDGGRYLTQPDYISSRLDHTKKFKQISAKNDAHKWSFFPRCIKTWNSLPLEIVSMNSVSLFEQALKIRLREGH